MNKKIIFGMLIFILSFGMISGAFAYHGHWESESGDEFAWSFFRKAHRILDEKESLALTEEQTQTIRGLKLDAKKSMIRQGAEVGILDLDIQTALHADPVDAALVQKLVDQKYEIKKALAKSLVDATIRLRNSLDEKQWETFKTLKKEHKEKFDGYRGSCGQE